MTEKLTAFLEMEHDFFAKQTQRIDYSESRYHIHGNGFGLYGGFTYFFASQLRQDLVHAGTDAKVYYKHDDGTLEDFTKYFPLDQKKAPPISKEQLSAINEQGKVLVDILKTKKSLL